MSSIDPDILAFLRDQIPERSEEELARAFEPCFRSNAFAPTPPKIEWSEEVEALNKIADEIEATPRLWPSVRERLPPLAVWFFGEWPPASTAEAVVALRDLAIQSEIWHSGNPKTGGKDPSAYYLADLVKLAFEDLDLKVTYGINPYSLGPSTRFGRIVQKALEYHGFETDWRRPAEAARKLGDP